MIGVLGVAIAISMGVSWPRVALLTSAFFLPAPTLAVLVFARMRFRSERPGATAFCDGVATELRSGASLRSAVAASAAAVGLNGVCALANSDSSIADLAQSVQASFPGVGDELSMAIREIARSGAGGADLLDEIGTLALAEEEVAREVRVASAPARATAGLFVGGPAVYLVFQASSGSLAELVASPGQRITAAAGLGLFALGLTVASLIFWRAR